jgi:putative redox protein
MAIIRTTAKWVENVRIVVDNSRNHSIVCDLPIQQGGNDLGPTALELALMSIVGCIATIFADICKKSKIKLNQIEVVANSEKFPNLPTIKDLYIKVKVSAKARKQLLEAAWRRTEENCPVVNMFKDAIPVKIELETNTN